MSLGTMSTEERIVFVATVGLLVIATVIGLAYSPIIGILMLALALAVKFGHLFALVEQETP